MKKTITSILCTIFVSIMSAPTFAIDESVLQVSFAGDPLLDNETYISNDEERGESLSTDAVLDAVDSADDECINHDITKTRKGFYVDGDQERIIISKDPEEGILVESEDAGIRMSLPDSIGDDKGSLIDGSVVFNDEEANVGYVVQTIESEIENQYSVRTMVTIGDSSAPHKYDFSFSLPDGYKIISAEDYRNSAEAEKGYLYIVNTNEIITDEETGELYPDSVFVIEPAWAKDTNGNDVTTHYEINGSTISQVVDFDDNSAFPIVADPQYSGYYYTKANVSYSNKWSSPKRCSSNVKAKKGETATIKCDREVTFSGSVSGTISGITTIGIGSSYSSKKGYSISFKGPAAKYMAYKAYYKIEKGTRKKWNQNTRKVVSSNSYTVKKVQYGQYQTANA